MNVQVYDEKSDRGILVKSQSFNVSLIYFIIYSNLSEFFKCPLGLIGELVRSSVWTEVHVK